MQVASTLYRASHIVPEMPRIAQPLAYWPELHMGIQSSIAGAELHQCAFDLQVDVAERERWMDMVGVCLAALHNFIEVYGPRRTFEDDLSDLCEYLAPLEMAAPALATRFGRALEDIASSAQGRVEAASVASHGALRTDQFLIEQDRLVLIDLDSFCWANPARDIANFLAYLQWKAMRQPQHATFIERGERAFLAGYATARVMPETEWLARYRAVALLKIVGRRFRSLTVQEWPMAGRLLDVALGMVNSDGDLWGAGRV
jgi:hypothetical protein